MVEKSVDVLEEDIRYSLIPSKPEHLIKECAACIFERESSPLSSNRESCTRKSTHDKVGIRKRVCCDGADVALIRFVVEVPFIDRCRFC
jgi:hypothetical protein